MNIWLNILAFLSFPPLKQCKSNHNEKAPQIHPRENLFSLKSTPHLRGFMEKVYLQEDICFKYFFYSLDKYSFAIRSPSSRSTFIRIKPPTKNRMIRDKIPKRGFPVTNPTYPIRVGPTMAANFPNIL